jgi:hypothetical protein
MDLPLLLAAEEVAAQGDEDVAWPVAQPLPHKVGGGRSGNAVVHPYLGQPLAAGHVGTSVTTGISARVSREQAVMISGRSGAFRMVRCEPRVRMRASVATNFSLGQVSPKWKRDRDGGRSELALELTDRAWTKVRASD